MKSPGLDPAYHIFGEVALQSGDHLTCCLVGKGQQEYPGGLYTAMQQMRDAPHNRRGLSRTGGGDDEIVSKRCSSSTQLLLVECA